MFKKAPYWLYHYNKNSCILHVISVEKSLRTIPLVLVYILHNHPQLGNMKPTAA